MALALPFGVAPHARANGDTVQLKPAQHTVIKVATGKPRTIRAAHPFYEIVLGDPEVASVSPLTDRSFYVLGNNLGTTGVALPSASQTV